MLIALGTVGTDAALILAVVALLANSVLQQMIQPFVMGATLGLNPLVVLVVTIGAGALFGMVGLTLAAPLTSAAVHIATSCGRAATTRACRSPGRRRWRLPLPRRSRRPARPLVGRRYHPGGTMRAVITLRGVCAGVPRSARAASATATAPRR